MSDTEDDPKLKEHPLEAIYRERYERSKKLDEEQDQIPLFMTSEKGKDSDAYRAIQALIDECSPDEIATNLKNSGNDAFKLGKNGIPDAIGYYTQAIEAKPNDKVLLASIYSNRAQANLSLANYGKCLADALQAIEIDPTSKSYYRAAKASFELHKYTEAGVYCRTGLILGENKDLTDLHNKILDARRKEAKIEWDLKHEIDAKEKNLYLIEQAFIARSIKSGPSQFAQLISDQGYESKVTIDESTSIIHWPVLFLYPEFFQSDFIADWEETISFISHIDTMFNPTNMAPWDRKGVYLAEYMEVYYEVDEHTIHRVDVNSNLCDIVNKKDFILSGMNPVFYIVSIRSKQYRDEFRGRYKKVIE